MTEIDKSKVSRICREAVEKLGITRPDVCARYAFRTLYPDLVGGWILQPETQAQRALLEQILPIAKSVIEDHGDDRRLRVAIKATVDILEANRIAPEVPRVAALVFKFFHPSLANPEHPIRMGLREEKMHPILAAAVQFLEGRAQPN